MAAEQDCFKKLAPTSRGGKVNCACPKCRKTYRNLPYVGREQGPGIVAEVKQRLELGSEAVMAREIADIDFVEALNFSLNADFLAHIEHILTDQWSAVSVAVYGGESVGCECDNIVQGLAAVWKFLADTKGLAILPTQEPRSSGDTRERSKD